MGLSQYERDLELGRGPIDAADDLGMCEGIAILMSLDWQEPGAMGLYHDSQSLAGLPPDCRWVRLLWDDGMTRILPEIEAQSA